MQRGHRDAPFGWWSEDAQPKERSVKLILPTIVLALAAVSPALAEEAIKTGPVPAQQAAAAPAAAPIRTLEAPPAAAAAPPQSARPACPRRGDPPHGAAWAGAGAGGYREAGAVVTAPLGRCASATIAVEGARGRWR
jgi:hypothetical protein